MAVTECLLEVVTLNLDCSVEKLLPEIQAGFRAMPKAALDVRALGAASMSFEREFVVGSIPLPVIPIPPLFFFSSIEVVAKIEGGSSARFEVGAYGHAELESSVKLSTRALPEIVPLRVNDYDAGLTLSEVDLHAHVAASIGPRLNLALFGVAGPFASAQGEVKVRAAPLEDPCWDLRFALSSNLGVRVTTPDLPIIGYATLFECSRTWAHLGAWPPREESELEREGTSSWTRPHGQIVRIAGGDPAADHRDGRCCGERLPRTKPVPISAASPAAGRRDAEGAAGGCARHGAPRLYEHTGATPRPAGSLESGCAPGESAPALRGLLHRAARD